MCKFYISLFNNCTNIYLNNYQIFAPGALRHILPKSSTTISNWLLALHLTSSTTITKYFETIPFRIPLSFDLWTSPNHRSFLGVVGHWATESGQLVSTTLGFRRFFGSHSGANIAETVIKVLDTYQIASKLGYITTDNATNNDSALVELSKLLALRDIKFKPEIMRVRCFGHIINLVVKGFLWGADWEAFEQEVHKEEEYTIEHEKQALKAWRKKGAMGKLHNIGTWILRTPQRRDRFSQKVHQARGGAYQGPLLPLVGNVTRWSSDAESIDRAFELRDILDEFIGIAVTEERQVKGRRNIPDSNIPNNSRLSDCSSLEQITLDELSLDDWVDLTAILFILKPFRTLTLELQGAGTTKSHSNGYLARVLPAMDELLVHLESAKITYSDTSIYSVHLLTTINHAWSVLDKYDFSPYYSHLHDTSILKSRN